MARNFQDTLSPGQLAETILNIQQGPFRAISANTSQFPTTKGIYFWYMRPEGYAVLLKYLSVSTALVSPVTDQSGHHLVYLGTAGTRITANNQTGLRDRFIWHVCNQHTRSQVLHGTLSTLRQTLGALLADDLMGVSGESTEILVNQFMAEYMSVAFVSYEGSLPEIGHDIDADEETLIKKLKPLLNLKNNPNARIQGHPTRQMKQRRQLINSATKNRIRS